MTLEPITGAFLLLLIIIIPLLACGIALVGGSLKYWRDNRKEELPEYAKEYHNKPKGFVKYFDGKEFIEGLEVDKEEGE